MIGNLTALSSASLALLLRELPCLYVPRSSPGHVQEPLRTREFWALAVAQLLIPTAIFPIAVHQVAYLADLGFSVQLAAAILGTMGS